MDPVTTVEEPKNEPVPAPADPFSLDENALVSLSPEQRAGLDPIIESWKKKASDEISKREQDASQKYKPLEEKAQALDKLVNYQPFVQWWQAQQKNAQATSNSPQQAQAIQQTKPNDIATQQEWQEAIWEASNGDATKLQSLQSRMMAAWATPFVQQMTERQKVVETQLEVKDMFERHPDAKELDLIGLDPKTKQGISLLEMGLDWAERNGKPLESGYMMAKQWADAIKSSAKAEAMGFLNDKRATVTAGNSTQNSSNQHVVEVANADELVKRSLEAQLSGEKDVRFVIKGK